MHYVLISAGSITKPRCVAAEYHGLKREGEIYKTDKYNPSVFQPEDNLGLHRPWLVSDEVLDVLRLNVTYLENEKYIVNIVAPFTERECSKINSQRIPQIQIYESKPVVRHEIRNTLTLPELGFDTVVGFRERLKRHEHCSEILYESSLYINYAMALHKELGVANGPAYFVGSSLLLSNHLFKLLRPFFPEDFFMVAQVPKEDREEYLK